MEAARPCNFARVESANGHERQEPLDGGFTVAKKKVAKKAVKKVAKKAAKKVAKKAPKKAAKKGCCCG
jgi:hypothetical protein